MWIFILLWLICGFIAAGFTTAYFTRSYSILPYDHDDLFVTIFVIMLGIASLVIAMSYREFGWKIPFTKLTAAEWDKYTSVSHKKLFPNTRPLK